MKFPCRSISVACDLLSLPIISLWLLILGLLLQNSVAFTQLINYVYNLSDCRSCEHPGPEKRGPFRLTTSKQGLLWAILGKVQSPPHTVPIMCFPFPSLAACLYGKLPNKRSSRSGLSGADTRARTGHAKADAGCAVPADRRRADGACISCSTSSP